MHAKSKSSSKTTHVIQATIGHLPVNVFFPLSRGRSGKILEVLRQTCLQLYRNAASLKRFEIFIKISAISAFSFCLPVIGQEKNGWQVDSLGASSSVAKTEAQQVYEVLLKMLDRWNAHDIEGHLGAYWKSPDLLVVIDSEQFNGWQQLHDS
jgi:hypothetical protein